MTDNVIPLPDTNKMKEDGSLWLAKLDRGLSSEEEVLLKQWLAESPKNHTYFITLAKQWDQLSVLSRLAEITPYQPNVSKRQFSFFAKVAAFSLLFLLGSLLFSATNRLYFNNELFTANTTISKNYSTAIGEKSTIYLPDSSILTLNTDSLVKIHFTATKRELILVKGEVHIKVAHNKKRKLVLSAGNKSFVAVGTAFNVQYDQKSTLELIVTEGKVGIADVEHSDEIQRLFSQSNLDNQLLVNAGQRVIIPHNNNLTANNLTKEDIKNTISDSLAWREGRLIFKGETLEEVINEMSRYSNIDFELEGDELKNMRIGGRFKTGDINGLLDVLSQQFNIKSNRLNPSRIKLTLSDSII
jgi:transmembrane sensor